jgi:hypothetical protein
MTLVAELTPGKPCPYKRTNLRASGWRAFGLGERVEVAA